MVMSTAKKITTNLPKDLLDEAQEITGEGITKTLKIALELLSKRKVYDKVRAFKGKYKSSLDLKKLREDK